MTQMTQATPVDILVMGAGAIGCFVGGKLASQRLRVLFVGRPRMLDAVARHGITLTDLDGSKCHVAPGSDMLADHVPPGVKPALVLLCVKSGATAQAAAELGAALPVDTPVLSLQNGIANAEVAARYAPKLKILPGMVPFNVAEVGLGAFHRGTAGRIAIQRDRVLRPWLAVFQRAGVALDRYDDMRPVLWSKLLINLNNPVNALSGLGLRDELMDRGYRRCLAALIEEALQILAWADIVPARIAVVSPNRLPLVLRLPTPLFRLAAARMLRIDAKARSSMADDLRRGRPTEIDELCGAVVRLAHSLGQPAPLNAKMIELVRARPSQDEHVTPDSMLSQLGLAKASDIPGSTI
jgi:2-dehydropantoate 2-reductase